MNRRILPFSLVVCGAILAYACSSKDDTNPVTNTGPEGGTLPDGATNPDDDGSTATDGAKTDGPAPVGANPILGITAATPVPGFLTPTVVSTEGPVWRTNALFFSTGGVDSHFVKLNPAGVPPANTDDIHAADPVGNLLLGNAYDPKTNTFVSCNVVVGTFPGGPPAPSPMALVRTPAAAAAGTPSTPIALSFDAGGAAFDSPNDLVVRKDGTIYVTDPGYQNPATITNHVWRVNPTTLNVFQTDAPGRPNGIALSVDEKTLYVSFTDPMLPATPQILKYPLAVDGAIGAPTPFAVVGGNKDTTALDGLAVDSDGNVYAAVLTGVEVFKPDGTKWGHIPAPAAAVTAGINGLAFGGADKKTLYMTSNGGMFQVTVKVAGID